jgi:hypothetical protein
MSSRMPDSPPPAAERNTKSIWLLAGVALLATMPSLASAQEPGADSSATVYASDYFARFNPVTAEDMVKRIPGFTLQDGQDRRGFAGASGNVLINGERSSSKTPLSEQLARIAARDVLRIDLYSGGFGAGDSTGQSLYVDVRLRVREAASSTRTFVAQVSRLDPSGTLNPLLIATSAFKLSDASVNLSVQAQPSRRGRIEFDRTLTNAGGSLLEQGPELLQGSYREIRLSGRATWSPGANDTLSLNAQIIPSRDGRHTFSEVRDPSGALLRVEDSLVEGRDAYSGEIGGDWERKLSAGSSFKVIGLASRRETGSDERFSNFSAATRGTRDTLIQRSSESGEYILRGVYSWNPGPSHVLELGAEGAFNFLDSALDVRVRSGTSVLNATPPIANTRVEEERGEISITDYWRPGGSISLESGLRVETSRISQSGDATQERTFTYWKPRLRLTWDPEGDSQFRVLVERDVAQLDFTEFATAVSIFDGNQFIGNPDLEPERTWRAQAEWERRLGAKGVVVVSAFRDQVEAVQDRIPIGAFDGPGNLGDGWRHGVRLDATFPLDGLGLDGGQLRVKGLLQETEVTDPVTGAGRRFSDEADWSYSIDLRQPIPDRKLLVGVILEQAALTEAFLQRELRLNEFEDPGVEVFVESTAIRGLVVRLSLQDALRPVELRERRFFSPDRSTPGNLTRVERRLATGAFGTRSLSLRVSGRF